MTHTVTAGFGGKINFACTGQNTTLAAVLEEKADHLVITGTITGDTSADRAIGLGFCLPIDPAGWTWWDNIDSSRVYAANIRFLYYETKVTTNHTPYLVQTYPIASINDGTDGLCIGSDISSPRHFKTYLD